MAIPNSKTTLKSWCKRRLGYPVIDINVDDDQIDDRIDEALQYFYTFQYGGMQRVYLKHKITQADVDRASVDTTETATDGNQLTTTLPGGASIGVQSLTLANASEFPASGSVLLSTGLGNAETIAYTAKTGNVLTLTTLVQNTHGNDASVTSVETADWSIGQAYLPMPDSVTSVLRATSPSARSLVLGAAPGNSDLFILILVAIFSFYPKAIDIIVVVDVTSSAVCPLLANSII